MKNIISFLLILAIYFPSFAQTNEPLGLQQTNKIYQKSLPTIFITQDVNVLLRSPEPVQFVDLSNDKLIGDLPTSNLVRLKIAKFENDDKAFLDSLHLDAKKEIRYYPGEKIGVITVVGQSYMAQYNLVYTTEDLMMGGNAESNVITNLQISEEDMQPLEYPQTPLSDYEIKKYAEKIIKYGNKKNLRNSKEFKMGAEMNNIYAMNDYIFLDMTFKNTTNLPYDIGNVEFSVDDKKIYRATNNQSITLTPLFQLFNNSRFRKQFRNIYVFKKFTFPNNKVLRVRIYEDGISGRTLSTTIKYSDLLEADTF